MNQDPAKLVQLTSPEIQGALDGGVRRVVFAAGAIEQHGPHLPLATDTLIGDRLAESVAGILGDCLVGPTIPFGISPHHLPFAGTISLSRETFTGVLHDYVASMAEHGFAEILIIGSHGGNFAALAEFVSRYGSSYPGSRVAAYSDLMVFTDFLAGLNRARGVDPAEGGTHAGESETSMILNLRPGLVRRERATTGFVGELTEDLVESLFASGMPAISPTGVIGDARGASAERGDFYLSELATHIAGYLADQLAQQ